MQNPTKRSNQQNDANNHATTRQSIDVHKGNIPFSSLTPPYSCQTLLPACTNSITSKKTNASPIHPSLKSLPNIFCQVEEVGLDCIRDEASAVFQEDSGCVPRAFELPVAATAELLVHPAQRTAVGPVLWDQTQLAYSYGPALAVLGRVCPNNPDMAGLAVGPVPLAEDQAALRSGHHPEKPGAGGVSCPPSGSVNHGSHRQADPEVAPGD